MKFISILWCLSVGGVRCEGRGSHGSHGLVLEGDEGHAQRFGVDLLLLLSVLLLQLGLPLGVEAHGLLLQHKHKSPL